MPDTDLRWPTRLNALSRYALAFVAGLVAIALRIWLTPLLGARNPYHTAWAAVVFAAWYCGFGPAILATLTSATGIWFWFLESDRARPDLYRIDLWGVLGFLLFSVFIIAFGEAMRRAKTEAQRSEESLRESEARLRLVNQNMADVIQKRTAELEQKSAKSAEQARLLDLANDAIFVRDARDRISYWNQGAERLYGWTSEEAVGQLTSDLLRTIFPVPLSEIAASERWEGELIHFKHDGSSITVASRWTTLRDVEGKFAGWLEINTDITARKHLERAARRLTGRILSLQDDERRRIARELHDSLGQYLVSVKVNLDLLSKTISEPQQQALLSGCLDATNQCLTETRTISHLLHPPLLDEAGFASAARWYVEGFAQRGSIEVELDLPPEMARMDRDVETALFRILQEALTNVHRHSAASKVHVSLQVDAEQAHLEITDNGQGIPHDRLKRLHHDTSVGVGLAGMRERVRELGGTLTVAPAHPGITVIASIPLLQQKEIATDESSQGASAA